MSEAFPTEAEAAIILAKFHNRLLADWERCSPWLEAALEHDGGFWRLDDVKEVVLKGDAHFWPGKACAVVTQWWFFPRDKAINIWLAGGDLRELVEQMFPAGEAWARERGATRIMIQGRDGWGRVMAPHGFTKHSTLLVKDLRP